MVAATPENVLGDFASATASGAGQSATFLHEGDRFIVGTDGPGGALTDVPVSETFGVDPLQQYLVMIRPAVMSRVS